MSSQTDVTKRHIPQLDGIRGLAIILVISFHYWGNIPIFSFGWCGVDLFFVLSGYLITSRLIALQQQKNSLQKFYINRALRILPLYYLVLIIFYIGFSLLVKKQNFYLFNFYNHSWLSFVLFFQNWSLIFYNGVKENFLDHFWSLAVEEQFYLAWPFFLYLFWQKKYFFKLIFTIVISIIIVRTALYINHPGILDYKYYFYNSFCRMDGFLIGGCLYIFQKHRNNKLPSFYYLTAFVIIIAGIFLTGNANGNNPFLSTIGYSLIAVTFAGLIEYATNSSNKLLSTIFNYPWIKFTGKISYGLYIFHLIVLRSLQLRIENWFLKSGNFNEEAANGISLFVCLIISYAVSVLSYFYFESYFLKRKLR